MEIGIKTKGLVMIIQIIISIFACGNSANFSESNNSNNKSQKNNIQNNISENTTKIEDKNMNNKNNSKSIKITVKNQVFEAELNNSETAQEFYEMLPMELDMEDVNRNEKFFRLSNKLTQKDINPDIINNGDIMLYGSNGIVVFYETFSTVYSYTPLGKIKNPDSLKRILGSGNVKIRFENW